MSQSEAAAGVGVQNSNAHGEVDKARDNARDKEDADKLGDWRSERVADTLDLRDDSRKVFRRVASAKIGHGAAVDRHVRRVRLEKQPVFRNDADQFADARRAGIQHGRADAGAGAQPFVFPPNLGRARSPVKNDAR